jgi:8-oxo-dGTP pyrophosphatase MutT (NUDIX family)
MRKTVSAGGILVRRVNNKDEILLLKYQHIKGLGFLKGHVEGEETLEETALREVGEETGLKNLRIVKKLGEVTRPAVEKNDERVLKTIHLFLLATDDAEHRMAEEEYDWFEFDEAVAQMAIPQEAEFLRQHRAEILASKEDLLRG